MESKEKIEKSLEDRKKRFSEEFQQLKEKYKLGLSPEMDFYEYKILPEEIQLALIVLNKHKVRWVFNLVEIKDDN